MQQTRITSWRPLRPGEIKYVIIKLIGSDQMFKFDYLNPGLHQQNNAAGLPGVN
jgi:hypothetical protein